MVDFKTRAAHRPSPPASRRLSIGIRPRHRVAVSLRALHSIFAPDIARPLDFRKRLRSDLAAIAAV